MSNFAELAEMDLADGSNPMFLVRWRGKQEGPYPASVIEAKLAANEIGLLHEIFHDGQWVTIQKFIADKEAALQAQWQVHEEQERGTLEAADQNNQESEPRFVTCSCQYCNGHVEFDVTHAGEMVACPHCGLETTLYVPQTPLRKPAKTKSDSATPPSETRPSEPPTRLCYYKVGDATKGPYTLEQLRALWMNGQITADALFRTDDSTDWALLRESSVLVDSKKPFRQDLRKVYSLTLKGVCLLSVLAFFLTNVSVSLPIAGKINVSMFDFLTPPPQGATSDETPRPNVRTAFSEDGFQFKKANAGAIICAVAVLGVILHYLLTLVWGVLALAFKKTFSPLNILWLALAIQFPILFSVGMQMLLHVAKSEAMNQMKDNEFAVLGFAFVNGISIQAGAIMWLLMVLAAATLLLPFLARKFSLPWDTSAGKISLAAAAEHGSPRLSSKVFRGFGAKIKGRGSRLAIGAGIFCLLCLLLAAVVMGKFSKPISTAADAKTKAQNKASGGRGAGVWSKSRSVRQGNVVVTVAGAKIGPVGYRDLMNRPQFTVPYLTIALSVSNLSGVKKLDFETWRGAQFDTRGTPSLSDDHENDYKLINVTPAPNLLDPSPDNAAIHPQRAHYDYVVFELPVQNINWLHLEVPARNFGGSGMLRFEIPASRISGLGGAAQ